MMVVNTFDRDWMMNELESNRQISEHFDLNPSITGMLDIIVTSIFSVKKAKIETHEDFESWRINFIAKCLRRD